MIFVRSAERDRDVRTLDGDADRCDVRDDDRGIEFRPSFTLNFTLNMILFFLRFGTGRDPVRGFSIRFFSVDFCIVSLDSRLHFSHSSIGLIKLNFDGFFSGRYSLLRLASTILLFRVQMGVPICTK